jgi:hypothetical protein
MENTQLEQLTKLRSMVWSDDPEMHQLGVVLMKEWWSTGDNLAIHKQVVNKEVQDYTKKQRNG